MTKKYTKVFVLFFLLIFSAFIIKEANMALTDNRTAFTFNHSDQIDEYGASIGDHKVVQANFDSRAEENLTDINNIKDSLRSDYETKSNITTNRKLSATGDFTGTMNGLAITNTDPFNVYTLNNHINNRNIHSRAATIVISASDCLYPNNADFICDGTNDEVTIQAAFDALPDAGGKIIFTEGTFFVSDSIYPPKKPMIIQGSGDSTVIKLMGTLDVNIFILDKGDPAAWYLLDGAQGGIIFQNIKFTAETLGKGAGVCFRNGISTINIEKCTFEGLNKGLNFDGIKSHNISVDGNNFMSNITSLFFYDSACHDYRFTNNKEIGVEHLGYDTTVRNFVKVIDGECFEWLFDHNSIEHIKDTNGLSIAIDLSSDANADILINNNSIETCDTAIKYVGNFAYEGKRLSNLKTGGNSIRDVRLAYYYTGFGDVINDGNMIIGVESDPVKAFQAHDWTGNIYNRNNLLVNIVSADSYVISGTTLASSYSNSDVTAPNKKYTPSCRVYNDASQSVSNATWYTITFNSESFDTDTMHDTASNTSRITCKTAGKYVVNFNTRYAANATGLRWTKMLLNGLAVASDSRNPVSGEPTVVNLNTIVDMAVGDYLIVQVYQSSGSALNILGYIGTDHDLTEFSAVRIGD